MAAFLSLPSELIPSIFAYLSDEDYFTARLTCKYLEAATLSHFGKQFFRKKGYLITSPSLNVLRSVARHPELRKHVQHVWFNPDLYTFVMPECTPDPHWPYAQIYGQRVEEEQQSYEIYQDCMHDHRNMLYSSNLRELLTETFQSLPHLEVVGMRRSEDHRPWGWSRLKDAIGEDPRILGSIPSGPMSSLSGPTHLFLAIIHALSASNVMLKRLYTDAVEIDNILPTVLSQEKYDTALPAMLYLEINASKAWLTQKARNARTVEDVQAGDGLLSLLRATPQLRELGLQIFRDLRQSYLVPPASRNPDSWRQSYPYLTFEKLSRGLQLQCLTRLKLEKLITSAETLKAFMKPSRANLISIKIRDVRLLSTTQEPRPWGPVFQFCRDDCPQLSYVLFYHLMYELGGVSFVERPPAPVPYPDVENATGAPNPPFGEPAGGELFIRYDHIALEGNGRADVQAKLERIVERHWYQQPIFSYAMDESLWHTDTSDEEM
ncbi:hypothetical protein BDY17DRAFT_248585 [Neohortaea acidophila]|uniref:F-box domain-containing protein n=1 Tax=Neohortaea acidophila TaxID=245834 RepID=A0A6A6PZ92_9PEZI|nr:uncharacterized protein BDY17DRAFT_248585 [Neohortaea acidophila]KAF2484507.1 hypothetical protein BDY17DRAFT_248585 [Neohortaea acidophila]